MPFLIVLYSLIRGLSFGVLGKTGQVIKATPRYIPNGSQIYKNLVANKGQMHSWFGMDLSSAPFSHHGSDQAVLVIPYLVLIGMAIFLQYYQMKQMNSRNPQAAAANPQMQQMQKFFPIIFGVIYLRVPAGATIYMVISSAMRIGTQEIMFRTGMVTPVSAAEREIGGGAPPGKGTGTSPKAIGTAKPALNPGKPPVKSTGVAKNGAANGTNGKRPAAGKPSTTGKAPVNGKRPTNGKRPVAGKPPANGKKAADEDAEIELAAVPKEHPRSRSKRTRKAR
jgi:hypothetical protein